MSDRIAVMDQGQILQIGTPTEIYEHPTRRFVADFIGETNFLEAEVVALDGGRARVRLSDSLEIGASVPDGMTSGARVTAAVRPERVGLTQATENSGLSGRIETIVYFGTDTTFHLTLDGGTPFVVRVQNRTGAQQPFSRGDHVAITVPDDALQVLRD